MGSYDGAEACELVGLFLLSKLQHLNLILGLFWDDGLGVCSLSAFEAEDARQEVCRIFQSFNLKITSAVNHKIVNFLDVNLDLETGLYRSYRKENDTLLYVNRKSNHPPSILKNIPAGVDNRLSSISADETVFKDAVKPYTDALVDCGYANQLKYDSEAGKSSKERNRGRNIAWLTPLSQQVSLQILVLNF